jgi:shikimate dehydrogenase
MCAQSGAKRVFILNRTASSAEKLADEVNQALETDILTGMGAFDYPHLPKDGKLTVIQCTSLGMHPYEGEALIDDRAFYERVEAGFEMIYHPAETQFMKMVQTAGGKTCNGLKMLLYQGIAAFELWHGIKVGAKDIQFVGEKLRKTKIDW